MTPVGHTLTGLAIGLVAVPRDWPPRRRTIALVTFVLLANAPDWPLPGWGHDRYDISHSLFVSSAAIVATIALVRLLVGPHGLPMRIYIGGALAWLSHLLLDTTYNHGKGLAIYWPWSDARLALPIPWFATMDPADLFSTHNLTVWMIEAAFYGSLFAAVWFGYRKRT